MARYIDADALRDALYDADAITMKGVRILNQFPTISPDEVRGAGKWKMWEDYYGSNVYQCSVCGADWDMIDGTPEDNDMNYCPNCGAKMSSAEAEKAMGVSHE